MELPFAKLETAGNGYIAVDGRDLDLDWSRVARAMTAPHFGVGSDGGLRTVWPTLDAGRMLSARLAMGAPTFGTRPSS